MSFATEVHEPETDEAVQWVAERLPWAIVGAFGVWAGWGWLADGINALSLLLAVVFGLFQIATNILAVKVRELARRGDVIAWLTCVGAVGAMIATGLLTHEGLVHAYDEALERNFVSADPVLMSWLLLVVPYLEPLMFWINRLLTEPARPSKNSRAFRGLVPWLAALLMGSPAMAASPAHVVPEPRSPEPVVRTIQKVQARALEPDRAQAKLMIQQGQKPAAVHAATKVPLSTLKRWRTEMETAQAARETPHDAKS